MHKRKWLLVGALPLFVGLWRASAVLCQSKSAQPRAPAYFCSPELSTEQKCAEKSLD